VKEIVLSRFITKAADAVMIWFEDNSRPKMVLEEAKARAISSARFYDAYAVCGASTDKSGTIENTAPSMYKSRGSRGKSGKSGDKRGKKTKRNRILDDSSDEL
jgi:hypothetical protein